MALGFREASKLFAAGVIAHAVADRLQGDPCCGINGLPVTVHEGGNGRRDGALYALPLGSGFG